MSGGMQIRGIKQPPDHMHMLKKANNTQPGIPEPLVIA
jgi:hypothetical protein